MMPSSGATRAIQRVISSQLVQTARIRERVYAPKRSQGAGVEYSLVPRASGPQFPSFRRPTMEGDRMSVPGQGSPHRSPFLAMRRGVRVNSHYVHRRSASANPLSGGSRSASVLGDSAPGCAASKGSPRPSLLRAAVAEHRWVLLREEVLARSSDSATWGDIPFRLDRPWQDRSPEPFRGGTRGAAAGTGSVKRTDVGAAVGGNLLPACHGGRRFGVVARHQPLLQSGRV